MTSLNDTGEPVDGSRIKNLLDSDNAINLKNAKAAAAKEEFNKVSTANPLLHELLDRRIVRITGVINDAQATEVIAMLHLLDDLAPGEDIELRINSPGGSITAGLAIYDAMKALQSDVRTVCEGQCASMGAVLLAAGTPGKRHVMPTSRIMVHGPSGGMQGTERDMKIYVEEMQRNREILVDLLSRYSGLSVAKVEAMMDFDHFMSPGEAKALGLIDDVIEPRHKPPAPSRGQADVPPPCRTAGFPAQAPPLPC